MRNPTPQTIEQFKKLKELTCAKCATCPVSEKYRCCDKMFCEKVEQMLAINGDPIPAKPNVGGIPFMGEKGCVVPAHLRPFCTGYVCPSHLLDRKFRREYERLIDKIDRAEGFNGLRRLMNGVLMTALQLKKKL